MDLMLFLFVTIFGLRYSIKNWILGSDCVLTNHTLLQSDLGKIFDIIWLISLIYLILIDYHLVVLEFVKPLANAG